MNKKDSVIECRNLSKHFMDANRKISVFENLNLSIQSGETIAIMGASGSGKSTLLHLLGGLDTPTSGQVSVCGHDMAKLTQKKRGIVRNEHLGFVYQFHHLLPEFSALENVMMPLLIGREHKTAARNKATDILEQVGLGERLTHRPGQLSGGERQRAAIARALVTNPDCILADEPTGNLDEDTAIAVMNLFIALNQQQQTALIVVTHDRQVANMMQSTYHLKHGELQPLSN
ncbi:lipoprotein-releasing ABC transporter ATP-binding protein LolD [Marinicella gelatinilytica]|uniref:lipoprotein-releasing ABC transporter ATP-binding protein LolD n=1 Tax=Marinicella gelatinilytica TaxID=2996017 RepID=UPI002260CEB0|nr:lipoprotein-releasing ABC transporter ATP-binding protein LolD [Marinicella gelatinilytica]MCX7543786.1 lipoprotein-releasing ABC transporter ATP-binding protein LolD [Marinicella gelatinilytica]